MESDGGEGDDGNIFDQIEAIASGNVIKKHKLAASTAREYQYRQEYLTALVCYQSDSKCIMNCSWIIILE